MDLVDAQDVVKIHRFSVQRITLSVESCKSTALSSEFTVLFSKHCKILLLSVCCTGVLQRKDKKNLVANITNTVVHWQHCNMKIGAERSKV